MPTLRSYKTNLNFDKTCQSLGEKWPIHVNYKGHASWRLPEFSENLVQITTKSFVKIHGGTKKIDQQILLIITPHVTTLDSLPFKWKLDKETMGEKQLREASDETLMLNASIFRVSEAYAQMVSQGVIPPSVMQGLYDQIRSTLRSKESFRNQIESSNIGPEVKALLGMEENRSALICSVWPVVPRAYSGFLGFAIVNNAPVGAVLVGSSGD